MLVNKPSLHPMAAAALRDFESRGLKPTYEHLLWLQDAAKRVRKASERRIASLVDWPVPCGGALLYPMSMAAYEWWKNLDQDQKENIFIQAFTCAHSHRPEVLKALADPREILKAAQTWYAGLTCSAQALSAALNVLSDDNDIFDIPDLPHQKKKSDGSLADYGAIVVSLCKKFPGTTRTHWAWECSMDEAFEAMSSEPKHDETATTAHEIAMNVAFRTIKSQIERELTHV